MSKNNNYRSKIIHQRRRRRRQILESAIGVVVILILIFALKQGNLRKADGSTVDAEYEISQSDAVNSYFDTSVLIGDARAEAIGMNSGLSGWDIYAAQDLNAENVLTSKIAKNNASDACTVLDVLSERTYNSVYIGFGIEELGWYNERYISAYRKLLDNITALQPGAVIYVMSVIPVSAECSANDTVYNNPGIDRLNSLMRDMCEDYDQVVYLDVAASVAENGVLPEDASTDGIHFDKEYCHKIMRYIIKENIQNGI